MLLDKNPHNSEYDVEFMLERPIGWSSACLDSTIDYYLSFSDDNSSLKLGEDDNELRKNIIDAS